MTLVRYLRPALVTLLVGVLVVASVGVRLPAVTTGSSCCRGGCGCDSRGGPDSDCCCSTKSKPKRSCCDGKDEPVRVDWVPACVARGCRGDETPLTTPPKLPEAVLPAIVVPFELGSVAFVRPVDVSPSHCVCVPPDPPPRVG